MGPFQAACQLLNCVVISFFMGKKRKLLPFNLFAKMLGEKSNHATPGMEDRRGEGRGLWAVSGLDEDLPAVCSAWPQLTQVCPERQHNHNSFASSLKPPHISKILRTDEKWKQTIAQPILINVKRITSALSISYCRPFHNIFIKYHLISDSRLTPFNMKFPVNFLSAILKKMRF